MKDFKEDIKLDLNTLDECAVGHAYLFGEWSEAYAKAILERDQLKEKITILKAQLDEKIRKTPEEYGWGQEKAPTEKFIEQQILLSEEHQEAMEQFIQIQYNVNILSAAKESFEHRKYMIGNLSQLYSSNYFANRPVSKEIKEKTEKKDREEQSEKLTKNERLMKRRSNVDTT